MKFRNGSFSFITPQSVSFLKRKMSKRTTEEEGLKVKELNAIKKLFNLRFCDEDDIEDLLQLIYSNSDEYKSIFSLEKVRSKST